MRDDVELLSMLANEWSDAGFSWFQERSDPERDSQSDLAVDTGCIAEAAFQYGVAVGQLVTVRRFIAALNNVPRGGVLRSFSMETLFAPEASHAANQFGVTSMEEIAEL